MKASAITLFALAALVGCSQDEPVSDQAMPTGSAAPVTESPPEEVPAIQTELTGEADRWGDEDPAPLSLATRAVSGPKKKPKADTPMGGGTESADAFSWDDKNGGARAKGGDDGSLARNSAAEGLLGGQFGEHLPRTPMPERVQEEEEEEAPEAAAQAGTGGENYRDYGINPLTMTEQDRFSTFAADVDTASYSLARAKLNSGWLPNTASVRVEEFVNGLDYEYDAPKKTSEAPFAVSMEAAPSPWDRAHHILRIGVQGEHVDVENAAPVHLTFLIDVSGSMNTPAKLDLAKSSMAVMVDHLGPDDTVAIATYAGASEILLEPTTDRSAMRKAIDGIRAGGGTHMDSGMNLAYTMAATTNIPGHESRVIVLSDGDANIGRTSVEEILARVDGYTEEGITLTTIGLGMGDYNDVMMEQLANQGDGAYFYVDSQAEADKVFGEDLIGTTRVIAKDLKLQVEFNPKAVMAYRLIGYENRDVADHQFRNDQVDAGEIGSGHQVTALYDVVLRDDAKSQELATVRLRAKPPGPDAPAREWATTMSGSMLRSEVIDSSEDFRKALAVASFAELLRGSPYAAELSYREVYSLALGAGAESELLGLIETAGQLSGERDVVLALR
ncbi:MAG: DUF3520 domain-containing protein [Proteobacteria bacterium]|nr:DUF3520 domain-containing protein [Pseudomonadota bacterium]MCP4919835.1 DUF3520 domain-containing protein [Pseudomonadota bacterium]